MQPNSSAAARLRTHSLRSREAGQGGRGPRLHSGGCGAAASRAQGDGNAAWRSDASGGSACAGCAASWAGPSRTSPRRACAELPRRACASARFEQHWCGAGSGKAAAHREMIVQRGAAGVDRCFSIVETHAAP
jgi:hypothetical protein